MERESMMRNETPNRRKPKGHIMQLKSQTIRIFLVQVMQRQFLRSGTVLGRFNIFENTIRLNIIHLLQITICINENSLPASN